MSTSTEDRTATHLRTKAVEAYQQSLAAEQEGNRPDAISYMAVFYALAEAYAFHTDQPQGMVEEVLVREASGLELSSGFLLGILLAGHNVGGGRRARPPSPAKEPRMTQSTAQPASPAEVAGVKVGDFFYSSWGYDQTNVEFFQIVEVKPRSVVVRQILENNSDHGQPGGGRTAPRRYEYTGPKIHCPINEGGRFSAGPCFGKPKPAFRHPCHKWDGRSVYTSSDR